MDDLFTAISLVMAAFNAPNLDILLLFSCPVVVSIFSMFLASPFPTDC
jgi:hypothetical protein